MESGGEGKDLYMKGICIQGNVKNANQRVYPTFEISKAVQKVSDQVAGGSSVLGEVDHPEDLKINLDRVSHMITSMWMDGHNGDRKIKDSPNTNGKISRNNVTIRRKIRRIIQRIRQRRRGIRERIRI